MRNLLDTGFLYLDFDFITTFSFQSFFPTPQDELILLTSGPTDYLNCKATKIPSFASILPFGFNSRLASRFIQEGRLKRESRDICIPASF